MHQLREIIDKTWFIGRTTLVLCNISCNTTVILTCMSFWGQISMLLLEKRALYLRPLSISFLPISPGIPTNSLEWNGVFSRVPDVPQVGEGIHRASGQCVGVNSWPVQITAQSTPNIMSIPSQFQAWQKPRHRTAEHNIWDSYLMTLVWAFSEPWCTCVESTQAETSARWLH